MENALLVNFDNMSDEELELQSMSIFDIRLKRYDRKLKNLTRDLEKEKLAREKQGKKIEEINETLKVTCIDRFELAELDRNMRKKVFQFVGKIGSNKYILFFKYYKAGIVNDVKSKFGENDIRLNSIKDLKKSDFDEAKDFIKRWKPTGKMTNNAINKWNEKLINETITKTQEIALDWYMNKITFEGEEK
ncbi:hypothetical protein DVV91_17235 [Clostridium botulinum]|uniref:ORF6C domain-containing protein n=1 Tax=Clostridium botulinum TaxID=1491 RepID=UPI001967FDEF|nr:ORF6C domain-containing protein [Clostridium botulinum]MBN1076066.1 hypothetical protein [Clostridium botulinum]